MDSAFKFLERRENLQVSFEDRYKRDLSNTDNSRLSLKKKNKRMKYRDDNRVVKLW